MIYNLSKMGYILNSNGEIEKLSYKEYLREFGADETTTGRGVAPRLYVDGSTVYSWGVRGNSHSTYAQCNSNREAKRLLYEVWESNLEKDCNFPMFFTTKKELFEDLAYIYEKNVKIIKRYFSIKEAVKVAQIQAKKNHDNRPLTTEEDMINYINNNKEMVEQSLAELSQLKREENKDEWQVKANSLIQKVSNNDFRTLRWKEIYNLIHKTV